MLSQRINFEDGNKLSFEAKTKAACDEDWNKGCDNRSRPVLTKSDYNYICKSFRDCKFQEMLDMYVCITRSFVHARKKCGEKLCDCDVIALMICDSSYMLL